MKTKLFLLLLLISSVTFAQNWSQVGAAQFTNFASDGAIATHPTTGEAYVAIIEPLSSSKISVQKFDGSNWVAQGALVGLNAANIALQINHNNNQPIVAYRDTTDSTLYVYTFDGTTWTLEFNHNVVLADLKVQIQFNTSGDIRVSGYEITSKKFVVIEKKSAGTLNKLNGPKYNSENNGSLFDYNSFDKFYIAHKVAQTRNLWNIAKLSIDSYAATDFRISPDTYRGESLTLTNVSGISDNNYVAAYDITNKYDSNQNLYPANEIVVYNGSTFIKRIDAANDIVQFRKNFVDNKLYIMYADKNTENIVFESFNSYIGIWSTLPDTGITSNSSNFFINMAIDKVNGNLYALYLDGVKASVRKFTIIPPVNQPIIYVDKNATGNNNGSSWANASSSIQYALENIGSLTTEIWIAKGTYTPDASDRAKSFNIISNNSLKIYGGFAGTETSITQRDIANNPTIFSGDLNGDDAGAVSFSNTTKADNSYNIVKVGGEDVVLDGITIANANGNGSTSALQEGSAVTVLPSVKKITLNNCTLTGNVVTRAGVVSAIDGTGNVAITFSNSTFKNNLAKFSTVLYSRPNSARTLTFNSVNSLYANNTVDNVNGSGMFWFRNDAGTCTINTSFTNDTFVNNTINRTPSAGNDVSVIDIGQTKGTIKINVDNTIFWNNTDGNSAIVPAIGRNGNNGYPPVTNILVNNSLDADGFSKVTYKQNIVLTDPLFTSATDFSLQANSPAINTGDNAKLPTDINADILGNSRIFDTTVDLGAYEFGSSAVAGIATLSKIDFSVYPNPTNGIVNIKTDENIKLIEVFNLQGQKAASSKFKKLNINSLNSGIYFIKITTDKNLVGIKKIVKK
ncbi:hypothetical protein CW731_07210 [Polaribacter sp. ALD11]|uniref:T9SS type A sorting domain-containing protein n=1 Tax=Polaribacter sp. ALD11 TaxID=2058137 RepID=UPI000C31070B|nr:T9SS type A sorting domain-containing protein [Polaribacter sp. ALD11]AUC85090.1 hypothetical protein CW731_07210 [Polaribacter sp. ALD11]